MTTIIIIIHVTVSIVLIFTVLLQAGKGAEMGAAFGGSSKTIFGPRGAAGPLAKVTIGAAGLFMLTSLYLTWASNRPSVPGPGSQMPVSGQGAPGVPPTPPIQPAQPGAPAPGRPGQVTKTVEIPLVPVQPGGEQSAPVTPAGGGAQAPTEPPRGGASIPPAPTRGGAPAPAAPSGGPK